MFDLITIETVGGGLGGGRGIGPLAGLGQGFGGNRGFGGGKNPILFTANFSIGGKFEEISI